ncbi:MAG: GspE/PulE family protein [Variovorax sp.]
MAPHESIHLGELLVSQQLLTEEQLAVAHKRQHASGQKLGRTLVDSGFVTEEQICSVLARHLQIPYINLKRFSLNPRMVHLLPEAQARRFRAIVLDESGGKLRVALTDPTDLAASDKLKGYLKRDISIAVISETQLMESIDRIYRRTDPISALSLELTAELAQTGADFASAPGSDAALKDAPVVKLLQSLFEDAARVRASDIHIEPQESCLHVRFRIDGVLQLQSEADSKIAAALVLRLKLMSDLDISERRLPQDGRFSIEVRGQTLDVRISTMPTQHGESVVMRLLNQSGGVLELDRLGMPAPMLERVQYALSRASGMILVTGPTGCGKTTTLYAALAAINTPDHKIITVEDPVEYRLAGINQVQVHEKIELSFERVLRAALRQDPDVILVGEMRDRVTAEIGLRAAMTGHLVLSTLHTNDAASTPIRLLDMGIPAYMVAMSLNLVIAQRLMRQVCKECAVPYAPTPAQTGWLRRFEGDTGERRGYVQGIGCASCNGTGYIGRTAIYEMLEMTQTLARVANDSSPAEFVRLAREQIGDNTLLHNALRLVAAGKTTLDEATRVSAHLDD